MHGSARAALAALLVLGAVAGCGRPAADAATGGVPPPIRLGAQPPIRLGAQPAARFVVWESNRTGLFRIWRAPYDGASAGEPRQISRDEAERDHCCAVVSPDGERVAYLSLPPQRRKYPPKETTPGELRLIDLASGRERTLSATAHHDGEYRVAVWWSETELVYLEGDGSTRRLDLASGAGETLVPSSEGGHWLVARGGRFATQSKPTFSTREPDGSIRLATDLGGCQPTFSFDARFGIWSAGAGGPLDRVDLATRETRSIVRRGDPRLPEGRRYLYFPALSADLTLFAWAASDDTHDHFRADYDVFVAEVEPATLELTGAPVAIAPHPAVDRYPDPYSNRSGVRAPAGTPAPPAPSVPLADPSRGAAPLLLWTSATADNVRAPGESSESLAPRGAAWFDRRGRLALAGGFAEASAETAARVDDGLHGANVIAVAFVVEPDSLAPGAAGPLVALERGPRRTAFAVRQRGAALELFLLTAGTKPNGLVVARAPLTDGAPHAVAFRYSPGRMAVFVDGKAVHRQVVRGDFHPWKGHGSLRFGAELASDERFRGWLSDLAIWNREPADQELAAHAAQALARLGGAPEAESARVEARLVARSAIPTLDSISPYRSALVVEEFDLVKTLAGQPPPKRFRVARWALLDGRTAPTAALALGTTARLTLEPYNLQPQLETVVLSDTLPAKPGVELHASVGVEAPD